MSLDRQIKYLDDAKREFEFLIRRSLCRGKWLNIFSFIAQIIPIICGALITFNLSFNLPESFVVSLAVITSISGGLHLQLKPSDLALRYTQVANKAKLQLVKVENLLSRLQQEKEYIQTSLGRGVNPEEISLSVDENEIEKIVLTLFNDLGELKLATFATESLERIKSFRLNV